MKTEDIRKMVDDHMASLGFQQEQWRWDRGTAELVVMAGGKMRAIQLKSGISLRDVTYALGRIHGWADLMGIAA